ncbi:MAG: PQQ-dependent dehydrogenase, methanol/ethanol family, partial [Pseudomonadales bacterium]
MLRIILLITSLAVLACNNETKKTTAPETLKPQATANVDWTLHGNDAGEQRFSPLAQINRDNIGKLGLTWSFDMYTRRGVEATPLVVDGTMYVTGSWSMVYALDAASGELKWFYDPKVDRAFLAKGCCDAVNRGVAYANGKVIVGAYDGRLVALNAPDGSIAWDVQTTDRSKSYTITGAPRIAGDKVIIGNGGAELGVRGYVTAYDIDSGEQAWRFYTVPGNPADGFENDQMKEAAATWNGEWWKWGGGGTVWDSMAYDPRLDLLYIGVGNGSPWNQAVRSPDGGDNLFLASIVALRPDTGEYVWHYQTTPGETWDFTATQHIMLADLEIEGVKRKVLMQAPKNGFFYVLDRATGELISAEKYTVVNWASHVDKSTGRPVETKDARVFDGKNISLPSNAGGHNWPPMSYNPETGLVYIPTMVFPVAFLAPTHDRDRLPQQGKWNVGFDRIAN